MRMTMKKKTVISMEDTLKVQVRELGKRLEERRAEKFLSKELKKGSRTARYLHRSLQQIGVYRGITEHAFMMRARKMGFSVNVEKRAGKICWVVKPEQLKPYYDDHCK